MSDEVFMLIWLIYIKKKNPKSSIGQTNPFWDNLKKTHGCSRDNQEKNFTSNPIPVCTEEKTTYYNKMPECKLCLKFSKTNQKTTYGVPPTTD